MGSVQQSTKTHKNIHTRLGSLFRGAMGVNVGRRAQVGGLRCRIWGWYVPDAPQPWPSFAATFLALPSGTHLHSASQMDFARTGLLLNHWFATDSESRNIFISISLPLESSLFFIPGCAKVLPFCNKYTSRQSLRRCMDTRHKIDTLRGVFCLQRCP